MIDYVSGADVEPTGEIDVQARPAPNTVGYSAGAVVCPDFETAMRRREDHGEHVAWFNTGDEHRTRPYSTHVGWMQSRPEGFR